MTFWGYSQNDPIMADFGLINNTLITFELTSEKILFLTKIIPLCIMLTKKFKREIACMC